MVILPENFDDYVEYYPYEDEPGYDGKHDGGIKGLKPGAPKEVRDAYETLMKENSITEG